MARAYRWTAAGRRKRQACASATALLHQPWLQSTGPRTQAGKAVSRQNAIKWGHRIEQPEIVIEAIREMVQSQRAVNHSSR